MTPLNTTFTAASLALLTLSAGPGRAQSLADRVNAVPSGAVAFQFSGRPGLCGDGQTFMRIGHSYMGNYTSSTRSVPCIVGPLQVRLTMRDGHVARIDTWAGSVHDRNARALGAVSSVEAASFLMRVASDAEGAVGEDAIFAAVLADSATVWPALLAIAHENRPRDRKVQQNAVFWLSRYAAGVVAGRPNDPFQHGDEDGDTDGLKAQAVFVLSQLPDHGGIPSLLDIARSNRDPHVRGIALFWLGQSGDPRALSLIEQLLRPDHG